MFQNNWIAEQLVQNHQRNLQNKADRARQAQQVEHQHTAQANRRRITKLRSKL